MTTLSDVGKIIGRSKIQVAIELKFERDLGGYDSGKHPLKLDSLELGLLLFPFRPGSPQVLKVDFFLQHL